MHGEIAANTKCMNCTWVFHEDELPIVEMDGAIFKMCPVCKTDAFLVSVIS